MQLTSEDVVLFQGDSITDADRRQDQPTPNDARSLGRGYAQLAAARLLADRPGLTVHNRGISGNRVIDLIGIELQVETGPHGPKPTEVILPVLILHQLGGNERQRRRGDRPCDDVPDPGKAQNGGMG
ncbi:MAG: hypothetical protein AAGL98_10350, partial [Planctomycetota bacterium]